MTDRLSVQNPTVTRTRREPLNRDSRRYTLSEQDTVVLMALRREIAKLSTQVIDLPGLHMK